MYSEIEGDLIAESKCGTFDVIAHGCNCFCSMQRGLAPQMALLFGCDEFPMEDIEYKGDINKLGNIDYDYYYFLNQGEKKQLIIVNCYTQYMYGSRFKAPIDYEALTLCMRKINKVFRGKHIGLPQIGAGLAGGDWDKIRSIIQEELKDCNVTIVKYKI